MNYSLVSKTAASLLLVGVLAGCGDSATDPAPVVAAPTTFTVAGTAAGGAPFAGATVTLIDSTGATFAGGVSGADGSYTIAVPLTAKPPFVIQAVRDDQTLVSVIAQAKDSTTNITPVTTLIASRLSSSGDPAKLAAEIQADPSLIDATKLSAKVAEIVALIKPLMDAVGDSTDPLNGKLVADGTGADKVLDSLSISITPNSATTVNIEIAVKQKAATEGDQPAVVTFTNAATTADLAAKPALTVTAANLVTSGSAELIADLLTRMTACYALPQADRINSGGTAAADIKAAACKDIFVGNDPASYLSNGTKVSSTGAFSGIFGSGTGVTFDRGSYEFTRGNGDLAIAFRATDSSGSSSNQTLAVRADTDGKLRAIGNLYKYNGGVNAYQQLRNFINQPAADYYSAGYNLSVNNTADVADVAKVIVTSPKGKTFLLKRQSGSAYFPLVKSDATISGTSFVRLTRDYADTANSGDPALADTSQFFSIDRYEAADIIAIPAQATWKFDYYLTGNATTTPDATQYYKTRARAMTVAELRTQTWANLTDAMIVDIKESSVTKNGATYVPADPTSPADLAWVVPTGALEPTSIQFYGRGPAYTPTGTTTATRDGFNDKAGVKSSARSGTIACSAGAGENPSHCDSAGNYVADDRFTGMHLWASDAAGRDFAHFYAIYTVTIP